MCFLPADWGVLKRGQRAANGLWMLHVLLGSLAKKGIYWPIYTAFRLSLTHCYSRIDRLCCLELSQVGEVMLHHIRCLVLHGHCSLSWSSVLSCACHHWTYLCFQSFVPTYVLHLLTYLHISWSRVILEKLTGFQLVQDFPPFYGTRRFIRAFASVRHLSLSWATSSQSISPHPTSWISILIFSSHLRPCLPTSSFPQISPPEQYIRLSSLPHELHATSISFFSILSPEQYMVSSTDHSAPHYVVSFTPRLLVSLRPKYSPQHPILKHPQSTFLPQCQRPSFTPIQNTRVNYSSVYINLYIFG